MAGMSQPAPPQDTLYLVDASMYVFRAWHSMPDEFHDADGWPTNAVHGFARFLLELLERERPTHIAVAFDEALDWNTGAAFAFILLILCTVFVFGMMRIFRVKLSDIAK